MLQPVLGWGAWWGCTTSVSPARISARKAVHGGRWVSSLAAKVRAGFVGVLVQIAFPSFSCRLGCCGRHFAVTGAAANLAGELFSAASSPSPFINAPCVDWWVTRHGWRVWSVLSSGDRR
jgi:hypothetical protein